MTATHLGPECIAIQDSTYEPLICGHPSTPYNGHVSGPKRCSSIENDLSLRPAPPTSGIDRALCATRASAWCREYSYNYIWVLFIISTILLQWMTLIYELIKVVFTVSLIIASILKPWDRATPSIRATTPFPNGGRYRGVPLYHAC